MKTLTIILKWTGIVLVGLALVGLVGYAWMYRQTEAAIQKTYLVETQRLSIPGDSAAYQRGNRLAHNWGCKGCHGDDLSGGRAFADAHSPIGILYSANLTSGEGGLQYHDQDWIRALRHGVGQDDKSLWLMPAQQTSLLSNQDLAALISYLKAQPPVDKTIPQKSLKPLGRVLTFLDELPLLPARMIDHQAVYPDDAQPAVSAAYGKYLAVTCSGCHGADFKGGPPHAPGEPDFPDISATGRPGTWSEAGFVGLFRSGKTPEGRLLSPAMPIAQFTFTDDELKALYAYLHQLEQPGNE